MQVESKYIRSMLQSAQAGNNAALEQLFEMNLDRIFTISHRLTGNQKDAEVLSINTLIEAWKQLDKIRTDVPFKLWIESLNINLGLQKPEKAKEDRKFWNIFKRKKEEVKEPHPKISPLEKEICKLPDLERKIFVLSKIENYSIDELFGMVGLSRKEIKDKLEKAEKILLKADFIQTSEVLSKKVSELPSKIKADKKIQKDALSEIYNLKLENQIEEEEEIQEEEKEEVIEVTEQKTRKEKTKPAKVKTGRDIGIEIPTATTDSLKKIFIRTAVVILVAAAVYYLLTMGAGKWDVNVLKGSAVLDGEQLTGSSKLSTEEILKTNENSSVEIIIPDVGTIKLDPLTELKRLDKENHAALLNGTIEVDFANAENFFNLKVPGALVKGYYLGSVYKAEVTANSSGYMHIHNGWISIENNKKEIVAPKNYIILFDEALGASMPYHKNSNPEFINAVKEYFQNRSEIYLERIASLADKNGAITLWNLLKRISPAKRFLVYGKLNKLIPHPPAVTERDILELNEEKFQIWLEEIELNM